MISYRSIHLQSSTQGLHHTCFIRNDATEPHRNKQIKYTLNQNHLILVKAQLREFKQNYTLPNVQ